MGKPNDIVLTTDKEALFASMDQIMAGDCSLNAPVPFQDEELKEKWNQFMSYILDTNNHSVMQLNDSMTVIGDSSCVKTMLEQVNEQSIAIEDLTSNSQELGDSIMSIQNSASDIRDNSEDLMTTTETCIDQLNDSISTIDSSSESISKITEQIAEFKEQAMNITKIVDMVKKLASKSNLLALNASIEAARAGQLGAGFAVVAGEMRNLSVSTANSADDITQYVTNLLQGIDELTASIQDSSKYLELGISKIHTSMDSIHVMNDKLTSITGNINSISDDIATQSGLTESFIATVESLNNNYETLSKECIETGVHLYKISRKIDGVRSSIARKNSRLHTQDWLTIYTVDHLIFTWRVYNHLAGFEELQVTQLNNPAGCKFGKWSGAQTDPAITGSMEFKNAVSLHEKLHSFALASFNAKAQNQEKEALSQFQNALDTYEQFALAITALKKRFASIGDKAFTKL